MNGFKFIFISLNAGVFVSCAEDKNAILVAATKTNLIQLRLFLTEEIKVNSIPGGQFETCSILPELEEVGADKFAKDGWGNWFMAKRSKDMVALWSRGVNGREEGGSGDDISISFRLGASGVSIEER